MRAGAGVARGEGDDLAGAVARRRGPDPGDAEVRAFAAMPGAAMGLRHRALDGPR